MADYCIYMFEADRQFAGYRNFKCASDTEAVIWAEQLSDGLACELRSGDRLVVWLEARGLRELEHPA